MILRHGQVMVASSTFRLITRLPKVNISFESKSQPKSQGRCGLLPRKLPASLGEKRIDEMGSNRVLPASATMPSTMQTHTPSGSSNPSRSSSIKADHSVKLDATMTAHCRSENWAESYQDLSSWCSATSASSPAICQLPVIDEALVSDFDFQGEIDFDLRKSEEIASIPLEEDCSFNLWGSGSPPPGDGPSPPPPVLADSKVEKSKSVLLKDCWWSEIEQGKIVKELESSKTHTLTATSSSIKNNPSEEISSVVKEEVTEAKENMNPVASPQPILSDPIKMAELLSRFERIASITHPGVDSKAKAVDLMKILQDQIAAANSKKYKSPAAVADLHNYSRLKPEPNASAPSTSTAGVLPQTSQTSTNSVGVPATNSSFIFQSDPFEALFAGPDDQSHLMTPSAVTATDRTDQIFPQNIVAAPAFVSHALHATSTKSCQSGTGITSHNDLFSEAHHEIMKEASKPQQLQNQHLPPIQHPQIPLPVSQQHSFVMSNQSINVASNIVYQSPIPTPVTKANPTPVKRERGLSIQMPTARGNMPEMDLNFDSLLFGSPGAIGGSIRAPTISTPEVLKPLVDTPDSGSFDLLSYLCDDKVSTPPVSLDNNPFHFPQPSTTASYNPQPIVLEHKSNVMVVKPLTPVKSEDVQHLIKSEQTNVDNSAVIVELKPQIMPMPLSDVEEEIEERVSEQKGEVNLAKEEQVSPRPSRSSRKRKYSDDEFVLSPPSSEENLKSSRRRRTTSSKYDSDEEFTLPVKKARKKSVSVIPEVEDEMKPKRPRTTSSGKRRERTLSSASESDRYRELRDRNNEASRKSRLTRKAREQELGKQSEALTKENQALKVKVEEMENLVKKLREALLQRMMKK